MYIKRNISWKIILRFAWVNIIVFGLWSSAAVFLYHYYGHQGIKMSIPFQPISLIGIAVAFYIGFKNNASYDRFWEARKIWGGIVNYSRTWSNQVLSYVNAHHDENHTDVDIPSIHQELIYRHIAWINALRLQLRQSTSFSLKRKKSVKAYISKRPEDSLHWQNEVGAFLQENEYKTLIRKRNTATHLVRKQGKLLSKLMHEHKLIEHFRHIDTMATLEELYNLQGKCERIKNTPFPRQYAYFSKVFTWIFILLLPYGMVGEFAKLGHNQIWFCVPFCVLISWIFITMEIVGDNSEDPFENFINDVPMTAMCRTIEIDLREMLGETELPDSVKPINGILY